MTEIHNESGKPDSTLAERLASMTLTEIDAMSSRTDIPEISTGIPSRLPQGLCARL